ncbi:glycosyltransferase family 2 protein [Salisediminibacterium halotolerans]|uniref:glycosyltransferase family 2 protein n=1 Tax=Salisediminibacterium halotolerans TaxID=517425 RepID=UPI000EB50B7A|nr:glycosyltransferase [Salisediminibacterium halotolerans]RLJ75717.1 glycosyltransferase EpsE [Actinophytocola xinjiangensis]RPE89571.1 glycosyltransferase EpsE [Salisediminibacterium halotolerans]TWG36330.1 glycosyltransferase EpsE [Salisediminibacterium halotolerans]GEL07222.1 putative glycosyltransferase EpsE [Salisediminibacterium halotolerans]
MANITVIMGVYNSSEILPNCINSVIQQTYPDWEMIICDDCSTDNTYAVAEQFASLYDNIVLIKNEKNMGLAYSLNKCLSLARGEFIARTDADDISYPERFQKQIDFLNENKEYQVVGSSVVLYDDQGEKVLRKAIERPSVESLIKGKSFIHPTIMMRKETYDALGGYVVSKRTQRGQDTDLWFRFFSKGFKGYNIQEPLCKYHESLKDYNKRSFIVRCRGMKTRFIGYRRLKVPARYYVYLLKPLIGAFIPKKIMYYYHKSIKAKKIEGSYY